MEIYNYYSSTITYTYRCYSKITINTMNRYITINI